MSWTDYDRGCLQYRPLHFPSNSPTFAASSDAVVAAVVVAYAVVAAVAEVAFVDSQTDSCCVTLVAFEYCWKTNLWKMDSVLCAGTVETTNSMTVVAVTTKREFKNSLNERDKLTKFAAKVDTVCVAEFPPDSFKK